MSNELVVRNGWIDIDKDWNCIVEKNDGGLERLRELEDLIKHELKLNELNYDDIISYLKENGNFWGLNHDCIIDTPINVNGWYNVDIVEFEPSDSASEKLKDLTGSSVYLAFDGDRIFSTNDLEYLYMNLMEFEVYGSHDWRYGNGIGAWEIDDSSFDDFEKLDEICDKIVDLTGVEDFIVGDPIAFYKDRDTTEILRVECDNGINIAGLPIIWYDPTTGKYKIKRSE